MNVLSDGARSSAAQKPTRHPDLYKCKICHAKVRSINGYLLHQRLHSSAQGLKFDCPVETCRDVVPLKLEPLRRHLLGHKNSVRITPHIASSNESCRIQCRTCNLPVPPCEIVDHLREHFDLGFPVPCQVGACSKSYTNFGSWRSHLSKVHETNLSQLPETLLGNNSDRSGTTNDDLNFANTESGPTTQNLNCSVEGHPQMLMGNSMSDDCLSDQEEDDLSKNVYSENAEQDLFMRNIALFLMKLQFKHHIPASTVQVIVDEIFSVYEISSEFRNGSLRCRLENQGFSEPQICDIITMIEKTDCFRKALDPAIGPFSTNYHRNKYWTSNFNYVEPVPHQLDPTNPDFCVHMVPIEEALKSLLSTKKALDACTNMHNGSDHGLLEDFTDGTLYKNSTFFSMYPDALKIMLYQDAYSVVNPLSASSKKYKIVGIYWMLGSWPAHLRSKPDNIMLVTCMFERDLQKYEDQVFGMIVSEITKMMTGFSFVCDGDVKNMRCGLYAIIGDNLGQHQVGGFFLSFSARYPSRYCMCSREEIRSAECWKLECVMRTVESYNSALAAGQAGGEPHGITKNSVFNKIPYFHVIGTLPPCLGHDLFEGPLKEDIALCLKDLGQNKKWFTMDALAESFSRFKFIDLDSNNRPPNMPVDFSFAKIPGHAVQVWTIIRFLPTIAEEFVKEDQDEVWQLLLLIKVVVELVTLPSLSASTVGFMGTKIKEYLEARRRLFPSVTMKPKHHYLYLYDTFFMQYGPLINLWSLRFETKHSGFKQTIASAQNFKNVPKLLTDRHQLYQAYCSEGNRFDREAESRGFMYDPELFSTDINLALAASRLDLGSLVLFDSVEVCGTLYKKGYALALEVRDDVVVFGKCVMFGKGGEKTFAVVQTRISERTRSGDFSLAPAIGMQTCEFKNLLDFSPLMIYKKNDSEYVVPKHYLLC